jgi:hypothetical protein
MGMRDFDCRSELSGIGRNQALLTCVSRAALSAKVITVLSVAGERQIRLYPATNAKGWRPNQSFMSGDIKGASPWLVTDSLPS